MSHASFGSAQRRPLGWWGLACISVLSGCLALQSEPKEWPCSSDADCRDGLSCLSLQGYPRRCLAPNACASDSDCGANSPACNDGLCGKRACTGDTACGAYRCLGAICVGSCTSNADCQAGFDCATGQCVVHRCASDAECGAYRCQSPCLTTCMSDADCRDGNLCEHSTCAPRACSGDAGAGADAGGVRSLTQCKGFACSNGVCLTSCRGDQDCAAGLGCVGSGCSCANSPETCGAYACASDGTCMTSCSSNTDCAGNRSCFQGMCRTCAGRPAACKAQGTCSAASGCSSTPICSGPALYCNHYDYFESACDNVVGCTWSASNMRCNGMANCADQTFCWTGCTSVGSQCTGSPTPCEQLTPANCGTVDGCTLQ